MDSGQLLGDVSTSSARKPPVDYSGLLSATASQPPRGSVELQKMLIDERIRCETHKTNYQTLKEEHKKLQDEHLQLLDAFTQLQETKGETSEQLQGLVKQLQAQLASKSRELQEVYAQTMHPAKLEIIKAEITKELEEPLRAHMIAMDKEVEKYRGEYNKVRYEYTFLKAEYDHAKEEHKRNTEELNLRNQAQVSALQQERDNLLQMQKSSTDVDAQKLINLQRHKTQLEQRIKNLLDEMEELRKQKERAVIEADSVQRSQVKDMAHLQASLKAIESEKRSTEMQCERLQKELRDCQDSGLRLNQQIQDLSKECASLKSMLDEESHRHKVALTDKKLEMLKVTGELERERDALVTKANNLEAELDVVRASTENHHREMEELERESSRRIQEAREEEWNKNNIMQNEKLQLEEKCKELEQRLSADRSSRLSEREENEEKHRAAEMRESALRSEISELKVRLEHETKARVQFERDRDECATLRQKLLDKERELHSLTSSRQQALTEAERAREAIRDVRSDAEAARSLAQRAQAEAEKSIEANKLASMEDKHRLQSRIDQLEHKLNRGSEQQERNTRQQRKVKHALIDKVKHLRKKNELMEAQKEKLEIEMKAGRHGVSVEEHNRIKRRMREIKRRHNEFRHVIGLGDNVAPMMSSINPGDLTSLNFTAIPNMSNINATTEQENRHRMELSLLKKRLDEVAAQQQEQMEALDAVASKKQDASIPVNSSRPLDTNRLTEDVKYDLNSKSASGRYDYEDDFLSSSSSSKS